MDPVAKKMHVYIYIYAMQSFNKLQSYTMGRDSSVGIATRYGLDGPGIESLWG